MVTLGENRILSKDSMKLLGITIDYRLTFRQQTAEAISKTQSILPSLHLMAFEEERQSAPSTEWYPPYCPRP